MFLIRLVYSISLLVNFIKGSSVTTNDNEESKPLKIITHMGVGTRSHIKGIMEISTILNQRNHTILFASVLENKNFGDGYPVEFKSLGSSAELDEVHVKLFIDYFTKFGIDNGVPRSLILKAFSSLMVMTYDTVYPSLTKLVEIEKPDLIICDFLSPACGDIAELNGIPFINGFQTIDGYGIANIPYITTTEEYSPITTDELSFLGRFKDKVINPIKHFIWVDPIILRLNKVKEKFNVPTSMKLFKDFDRNLGLASTFEGFEPVFPLPPNIKVIGPIFSDSVPQLDDNLNEFLNSNQRVIYLSFGSKSLLFQPELDKIIQTLLYLIEENIIDGAIWGLGQIKQSDFSDSFTFRNSQTSINELFSSNHTHLRLLPWAPQVAILNHPNIKLVLNHGGLESILESIHAGKPILALSLIADQPRNARKLEQIGVGQLINRLTFTKESLVHQVTSFLDDPDNLISSNVQRLKTISKFSSRRKSLGADLIESYVYTSKACRPYQPHNWGEIPCEARHLIPTSYHMSYIKANLLDVYFTAFLLLLSSIALIFYTFYKFITLLYNRVITNRVNHPKFD